MNPLIQAIENNNPHQLKLLIELGHEMNVRNENSDTLLHIAAACNAVFCAEILIEKGMDVNVMNDNGHTPAFTAIQKDSLQTLELLTLKGFDILNQSESGFTLLHIAAINNATNCAWFLINRGVHVNAKSNCGRTPISMLENSSWAVMRELLLLNGAEYDNAYYHNLQSP